MSAHTPGPWVCRHGDKRPEIATVAWVGDWCVGISTPGYPGGNYRDTDYGSTEADARLIAAAPDLLDALQSLVDLDDYDSAGLLSFAATFAAARAAIVKATGENT